MKFLVVDINTLISAFLGVGNSYAIFARTKKEQKFWFIAPEFIFVELNMQCCINNYRKNV